MSDTKPRINPAAVDLLTRYFNSHKKGLPEWMKNAREAYFRKGAPDAERIIAINFQSETNPQTLECIDFVGIGGDDIDERFLEWANPDAAARGLKPSDREGGQGNGGKAYLRQMFDTGFFVSLYDTKLSVVSFTDGKKYILDFVPDLKVGKDNPGNNPLVRDARSDAARWLKRFGLPEKHNITIVRGVGPKKPVDPDYLAEVIQQFPQARETIRTCKVYFFIDGAKRYDLEVSEPQLHSGFPEPMRTAIPPTLPWRGGTLPTYLIPDYPQGELELCVSALPLQGQALGSWNRIDFRGTAASVIGWKLIDELALEHPQFGRYLYGRCVLPLLVDPDDNYEMQGRERLNEGPLSAALYAFIAGEANKILAKLAGQLASKVATKRRRNLEKLNQRLARWIESKLSTLKGLAEEGEGAGGGRKPSGPRKTRLHAPPAALQIHRESVQICRGVKYQLRAVAYDADRRPVPPGRVTWKSEDSAIAAVNHETGVLDARAVGLTTVVATSSAGIKSKPSLIQVHEAESLTIKTPSPATVGSNRRLPLLVQVKNAEGKTLKDPIVNWRSSDAAVATVGPDGVLVGGEVGDAEVTAYVSLLVSEALEVVTEKGSAGKPKGGGRGTPRVLLSGQDPCPFDGSPVFLAPTDPPVHQRAYKSDYDNNVFWINLQHPLADALLARGEDSVQWRTYHFQRLVDVYTTLELRNKFAESEVLDVDRVLDEIFLIAAEMYASAKEELFSLLYDETVDLAKLEA